MFAGGDESVRKEGGGGALVCVLCHFKAQLSTEDALHQLLEAVLHVLQVDIGL